MPHPKGKGSWYYIWIVECVLCGRTTEDRERRWTPRPENYEDRHNYMQDACSDHFL